MLVLFAHSWGWIGECQSMSIRRWVMHTAPLGLQLLRDPPQFSLDPRGPSYHGVPGYESGGTEEILTVERLCTGRVGLTCFCPLFTFAGYPAAVA